MSAGDRGREVEASAEPHAKEREAPVKSRSRFPERACRVSPRRRWLPCIPCHVFSIGFFVLVLVVLWLALRR
jgi:hypothetical protein